MPFIVAGVASRWPDGPAAGARALERRGRRLPGARLPPPRPICKATLDTYCVTCHNQRLKTGGLEPRQRQRGRRRRRTPTIWGEGDPQGARRHDAAGRACRGLRRRRAPRSSRISRRRSTAPRRRRLNPGRPLAHRLNRTEYANAVRDLLDLRIDPSHDAAVRRFERRLRQQRRRARRVAGAARELPHAPPSAWPPWRSATRSCRRSARCSGCGRTRRRTGTSRGMPIGTVGGQALDLTLPLDGEYQFEVRLFRTNLGTMRGLEYPHQLEIAVDGERVHLAVVRRRQGDRRVERQPDDDRQRRRTAASPRRVPLKAGPRHITIAFLEKTHALNTRRLQNYVRSSSDTIDFSGYPHIDQIIFTGPVQSHRPRRHAEPAPHLRLPSQRTPADEEPCATQHPERARAPRLPRRLHAPTISRCCSTSSAAAAPTARRSSRASIWRCGGCWPARSSSSASSAIRPAWRRARSTRSNDPELASRLSFFLWSTDPGRRAADAGGAQPPAPAGDARAPGAADARRPEGAGARGQLRRAVAAAAQPAQQAAELARVPRLRRQPPPRARHRARAVLRVDPARRPQRARPA